MIAAVLTIEICFVAFFAVSGYRKINNFKSQANLLLTKTQKDIKDINLDAVEEDSKAIESLINSIKNDSKAVLNLASAVPYFRNDSEGAKTIISKAEYLNGVLKLAIDAIKSVEHVENSMIWFEKNKDELAKLNSEGQALEKNNSAFKISQLKRINEDLNKHIAQVISVSGSVLGTADSIFEAAGFKGEKTYLLLFENNGDLRAGGGLISMYGFLKIKNGVIESIDVEHVSNISGKFVQPLTPNPDPLVFFMRGKGNLTIADSNWEIQPKFWLKRAYDSWNRVDDRKVDGVLAIGRPFFTGLVGLYEPLKIEGTGDFYSNNIIQALDYLTEEEGNVPQNQRTALLQKVVSKLSDKIITSPFKKMGNIFEVAKIALEGRNMFLYLPNESGTLAMDLLKNAIEIKPAADDEFYLADSDLGSGKADDSMKRLLTLEINGSENKIETKANINYDFTEAIPDFRTYPYNGYLRMVIPKDSKFNVMVGGTLGEPQITEEFGWKVLGNYFSMTFNQKRDVYAKYEQPPRILEKYRKEGIYNLTLRKEAGLELPYQVEINLPGIASNSKVEATSGDVKINNGTIFWSGTLTKDSVISVKRWL